MSADTASRVAGSLTAQCPTNSSIHRSKSAPMVAASSHTQRSSQSITFASYVHRDTTMLRGCMSVRSAPHDTMRASRETRLANVQRSV